MRPDTNGRKGSGTEDRQNLAKVSEEYQGAVRFPSANVSYLPNFNICGIGLLFPKQLDLDEKLAKKTPRKRGVMGNRIESFNSQRFQTVVRLKSTGIAFDTIS